MCRLQFVLIGRCGTVWLGSTNGSARMVSPSRPVAAADGEPTYESSRKSFGRNASKSVDADIIDIDEDDDDDEDEKTTSAAPIASKAQVAPSSPTTSPSKVVAQYEILHELGRGGCAKVKLCRASDTGTEYAIKIFNRKVGRRLKRDHFCWYSQRGGLGLCRIWRSKRNAKAK